MFPENSVVAFQLFYVSIENKGNEFPSRLGYVRSSWHW